MAHNSFICPVSLHLYTRNMMYLWGVKFVNLKIYLYICKTNSKQK